jgi:hypothetical protein
MNNPALLNAKNTDARSGDPATAGKRAPEISFSENLV